MASRAYEDYLRSMTWQAVRARQLLRDGYRCKNCHTRSNLQVHHWYYTREGLSILGKETPDDLATLCEDCHLALTRRRQQVFGTGRRSRMGWWMLLVLVACLLLWWVTR